MKLRWSMFAILLSMYSSQLGAQQQEATASRIGFECIHKDPTDFEDVNNRIIEEQGLYRIAVEQLSFEPFFKIFDSQPDLHADARFLVKVYNREDPIGADPVLVAEGNGTRRIFKVDIVASSIGGDGGSVDLDIKIRRNMEKQEIEIRSAFIAVDDARKVRYVDEVNDFSAVCTNAIDLE